MEIKFGKDYLVDVYEGRVEKYREYKSNPNLVKQYVKTVQRLEAVGSTNELRQHRALNYEKLKGRLKGLSSVRLNKQFRLLFREIEEGNVSRVEIIQLEDISNHYA